MSTEVLNRILVLLFVLLFAGGVIGWIWSGNWRIGATALVLLFVVAMIGGQITKTGAS